MAKKKSRTPTPPRRPVQAPKVRTGGSGADRQRRILYLVAGSGVALLAAALIGIAAFGGTDGGASERDDLRVGRAMRDAGCTFELSATQQAAPDHSTVPTPTTKVKWNTSPPANGPHYGLWAIWGFYEERINPRMALHNAEHGGLIVWYGPKVPQETKNRLRAWYDEDPTSVLVTPYPGLGSQIALTAWVGDPDTYFEDGDFGTGRLSKCPTFDEGAFETFKDAYRGRGPEGVPIENNQPGSGPGT